MPRWTILVIEHDGESHYLRHGADSDAGPIVTYPSRRHAELDADFWRNGLGDEVQSVNVVSFPKVRPAGSTPQEEPRR